MSETLSPFIQVETSSSSTSSSTIHRQWHHHHHYQRSTCTVLVCIVVVSLLANAVLVCMVVFNWRPWADHSGDPHKAKQTTDSKSGNPGSGAVCFTCDYFGPGIESNDTLYDVIRLSSGHNLCCLRQKNELTALFQKIISDEYSKHHIAEQPVYSIHRKHGAFRPVGAHMYMRPQRDYPPRWTAEDIHNTAFCSGVACRDGNIIIQEEGKYLVYSHITIRNDRGLHFHNNLLHDIRRKNPLLSGLGERTLLFSKTSPITSPHKTSFLSAILKLRSQDSLRVTVSEDYLHSLDNGLFANYFGVIKM